MFVGLVFVEMSQMLLQRLRFEREKQVSGETSYLGFFPKKKKERKRPDLALERLSGHDFGENLVLLKLCE